MKVHLMLKPENDTQERPALDLIADAVTGGLLQKQSNSEWYEFNGTLEDAHTIIDGLIKIRRAVASVWPSHVDRPDLAPVRYAGPAAETRVGRPADNYPPETR